MVIGENKKKFEEWYMNYAKKLGAYVSDENIVKAFYKYDFLLQIGVYLAYYDSLELNIDVEYFDEEDMYSLKIGRNSHYPDNYYKTRNEAYKEAFKKADEITNKL